VKRLTGISGSLILSTLLLVGCGSSDDSSEPAPCNLILGVATGGLSCVLEIAVADTFGSGGGTVPEPSTTPPPSVGSAESSPLISSEAFDVEPNNSMSTAAAASFPTPLVPAQSVGFAVNGTINNLIDGVDTYAFTAARSRTFVFQLCASRNLCNPLTLGGSLDVAIAYFSVVDQSGTELLSSQGNTVGGNVQHMRVDAGVLYYVMVVAEDTKNEDRDYFLRVFEAITEPEPQVLQESDPNAPILSGETMSLTATLDWIPPTMNVDGTALADLTGYIVYFGQSSGIYTDFRRLDNPGLVTYVLDLPSEDTWFIAITALNSVGAESDFSNEIAIDILPEGPPGDPTEVP